MFLINVIKAEVFKADNNIILFLICQIFYLCKQVFLEFLALL